MKKLFRNLILVLLVVAVSGLSSCGLLWYISHPEEEPGTPEPPQTQEPWEYEEEPLDPAIPVLTDLSKGNGDYGYKYFAAGTDASAADKLALYDSIDAAVENFKDKDAAYKAIDSKNYVYLVSEIKYSGLTTDEAVSVWKTYRDDHPLAYWLSTALYYDTVGSKLFLVADQEYAKASDRAVYDRIITNAMSRYVYEAGKMPTEYEKVMCLHDLIVSDVNYVYADAANGVPSSESWAHNIVGVTEKRGAVCEGYARTYQLALNLVGVENVFVTGVAGTGRDSGGHAWNLVKVDGKWYWIDPTWDDGNSSDYPSYEFFMKTDGEFLKTHTYHVPTKGNTDYLYGLPARAETAYVAAEVWLAGEKYSEGGISYRRSRYDGAEVVGATIYTTGFIFTTEKPRTLEIPETISYRGRSYPVTSIGASAFRNRTDITEVSTGGVLRVREDAFSGCRNLKTLTLSASVNKIYDGAFNYCTGIASVKYLGTKEQFSKIAVGEKNDAFKSAPVTFG